MADQPIIRTDIWVHILFTRKAHEHPNHKNHSLISSNERTLDLSWLLDVQDKSWEEEKVPQKSMPVILERWMDNKKTKGKKNWAWKPKLEFYPPQLIFTVQAYRRV